MTHHFFTKTKSPSLSNSGQQKPYCCQQQTPSNILFWWCLQKFQKTLRICLIILLSSGLWKWKHLQSQQMDLNWPSWNIHTQTRLDAGFSKNICWTRGYLCAYGNVVFSVTLECFSPLPLIQFSFVFAMKWDTVLYRIANHVGPEAYKKCWQLYGQVCTVQHMYTCTCTLHTCLHAFMYMYVRAKQNLVSRFWSPHVTSDMCVTNFILFYLFFATCMSDWSQNCWIDWNSATLYFKRLKFHILVGVHVHVHVHVYDCCLSHHSCIFVYEIWSGSNTVHILMVGMKKKCKKNGGGGETKKNMTALILKLTCRTRNQSFLLLT